MSDPRDLDTSASLLVPADTIEKARETVDRAIAWIGGWQRPMQRRPEIIVELRSLREDLAALAGLDAQEKPQ